MGDHTIAAPCTKAVPHTLAKQKLWVRITERTVEIFHKGKRVAAHMRGSGNRRHTTIAEHMPSAHRRYAGWTPARIRSRATAVGANTEILVDVIMRNRPHPEQGFRSCIGILRLAKTYGSERLDNAAILVTSQLPLAKWHDVIGEPTFADAILDRIVHNAHRIDLVGPSMRKAIAENINANAIDHTEQK